MKKLPNILRSIGILVVILFAISTEFIRRLVNSKSFIAFCLAAALCLFIIFGKGV